LCFINEPYAAESYFVSCYERNSKLDDSSFVLHKSYIPRELADDAQIRRVTDADGREFSRLHSGFRSSRKPAPEGGTFCSECRMMLRIFYDKA
jgi:hypothetical protein